MPQSKRVKQEILPTLSVQLQDESNVDLKTIKNAVFFFYPKANTPGCSKQAADYNEKYSEFESKGFKVFGVSKDSCKVLSTWKSKEEFQYPLISDKNGDFAKHFGLNKDKSIIRGHVVVKDGKVIDVVSGVKPLESADKALEIIENPPADDETEVDAPVRKETTKTDKKDVVMTEAGKKDTKAADKPIAKASTVPSPSKAAEAKSVAESPSKVKVESSPKKVGKEPVKTKEEIIHNASHDKTQEELKGKVVKELKANEPVRQTEKKEKEHTKALKKEVLAEIKKQ
eukprot:NODE_33_length_36935_cov_1.609241.p16 type:complete len:285 gc:universal NODE_33_length_36935_cov_1.609241:28961-29815(+)